MAHIAYEGIRELQGICCESTQVNGIVFVLVHGTFAKGTSWTKVDSFLATMLKEAYGENTEVVPFEWCGRNSHTARLNAGNDLHGVLSEVRLDHPDKPIIIIAHSHGGNVALYALRDPLIRSRVAGVVAMGTPFIQLAERKVGTAAKIVALLLCYFTVMGTLIGGLCLSFGLGWLLCSLGYISDWFTLTGVLLGGAAAFTTIYVAFRSEDRQSTFERRIVARIDHEQGRTRERLKHSLIDDIPLYHLTVDQDEVGIYLGSLIKISDVPFHLWKAALWIFKAGIFCARVLVTGIMVWVMARFFLRPLLGRERADGYLDGLLRNVDLETVFFPFIATAKVLGTAIVLIFCVLLAMAIIPRLIRGFSHGFGGESVFDNWFTRIYVSNRPEEVLDCRVEQVNMKRPFSMASVRFNLKAVHSAMRHCRIYNEEAITSRIIQWVNELLPFMRR